jgi:DNA-binding NarL/FixJ family response regulator
VSVAAPALSPASWPLRPRQSRRKEAPRFAGRSIRVVVGDDEPFYRAGIARVLRRAGLDVVATASNADDMARETRTYRPDVALVDIDMPPSLSDDDRVAAARNIRSIDTRMAVVILSEVAEERYARAVLGDQPEGFGYLVKASIRDAEDFTASVRRVARGGTAIDPVVVSRLAGCPRTHDPIEDLTNREHEVLALLSEGRSNRFIATGLTLTVGAVERHITSIFAKLGLRSNPADHRRVLATLRYLGLGSSRGPAAPGYPPAPPAGRTGTGRRG